VRFWVYDHIGKAQPYIKALQKAQHQQVTELRHADLILLDYEHPARSEQLGYAEAHQIPVILYPHGGNPLSFDSGQYGYEPDPHVRVQFVAGPGHITCFREQGGPERKFVISGFPWCEQRSFRPSREVSTVVFAPVHPSASGYMGEVWREANRTAQKQIWELFPNARVLVSVYATLEQNGLLPIAGWEFHASLQAISTALIDQADLVVATETFACLAIARGTPTVMFSQRQLDWDGTEFWGAKIVGPLLRYPYDLSDIDQVLEALEVEATAWRNRFIGPPFNPGLVVKTCERALKEHLAGNQAVATNK